jgi:hypothetical protein
MCTGAQRRAKGGEYDNGDGVTRQLKPQHRGNVRCGVLYINAEKYGSSATGNTTKYKLNQQLMLQAISMLNKVFLLYTRDQGWKWLCRTRYKPKIIRHTRGIDQRTRYITMYALKTFLLLRYLERTVTMPLWHWKCRQ